MSRTRSQRYRLTFEFVLKDKGDYAAFRQLFKEALERTTEPRSHLVQADYLAIEKVTEEPLA